MNMLTCYYFISILEIRNGQIKNHLYCFMKLPHFILFYLFVSFSLSAQQGPLEEWINQVYYNDEIQIWFTEINSLKNQYDDEIILVDSIIAIIQEDENIEELEMYQAIYLIDSCYIPQGHFDKAIKLVSALKHKVKNLPKTDIFSYVYVNNLLANLYKLTNNMERAEQQWQSLIDVLLGNLPVQNLLLAKVYFDYQFLYVNTNNSRSLEILELAESSLLKGTSDNPLLERKIYTEILKRLNTLGYYDKSEKYLNKIWNPYLKGGQYTFSDIHMEGDFLYEHMYHYYITRNFEKADDIYDKTETYVKKNQLKPTFPKVLIAGVYTSYGDLYSNQDLDVAIHSYRRAMNINNTQDDPAYWLQYLFNISKAYLYKGEPDRAEIIAKEIIEKALPLNDERLPFFYALLGNIYLVKGELDSAIHSFNSMINGIHQGEGSIKVLELDEAFKPSTLINEVFMLKTMADRVLENFIDNDRANLLAYNLYYAALMQFSANLSNQKPNEFLEGMTHGIIQGIFNTHRGQTEDSLPLSLIIEFSENFNSGFLWEKFNTHYTEGSLIDTLLLNKIKVLTDEITQMRKQMLTASDASIESSFFEKEIELEELERTKSRLYSSYTRFSNFNFTLGDYINSCTEDQLTLKYEVVGEDLYLFAINNDGAYHRNLGGYKPLLELASTFYNKVSTPFSDLDSLQFLAQELAGILIPSDVNNKVKNLVIIPDEILHFLPFEVLIIDNYLLKDYEVSYAESLSLLTTSSQPTRIAKSALFAPSYGDFAPPEQLIAMRGEEYDLEGAKKEVARIHEIIPSSIFIEDMASKEVFMKKAVDFDLLHLSMHSIINDEDPSLSFLQFSDQSRDSELYLQELYTLNLNAEMVVLSACNTGIGPEKSGEGIVSMKRAFKYAGVPSIVSSLWSVPDQATQEIMTEFYRQLRSGVSKSSALQQAKLSFLNTHTPSRLAHPFYWAGFVVDGDLSSLKFSTERGYLFWVSLFVGIILLIPVVKRFV